MHEVTDLILSCEARFRENSEVAFLLHDGRESFVARLSAKDRSVTLLRGEKVLVRSTIPHPMVACRISIEFAVIDDGEPIQVTLKAGVAALKSGETAELLVSRACGLARRV